MTGRIETERSGAVAVATLAQPQKLNAMTLSMWDELRAALGELEADPGVRAIVLRGAGREAFSAGADISEFPERRLNRADAARYSDTVSASLAALQGLRTPTIALVQGVCAGGGAGIAISCMVRFCDERLRFSIPAAKLGVVYEPEAVARLVRTVGRALALDILISARSIGAEEALRIGLVNRLVATAELEPAGLEYAERVARGARLPIEGAWLAVKAYEDPGDPRWLDELREVHLHAIESDEYQSSVREFLRKAQ